MEALALLSSFIFGSIPAGLLIARLYRLDIRQVGSGNIGATNVQRALGWGPGLAVLCFDALKGGLVVLIARSFHLSDSITTACGFAAVLGHNHSLFLGFKGGKGVATSIGTMLFIAPPVGLFGLIIGMANILLTRYVSAGSLLGALSATLFAWLSYQTIDIRLSCIGLTLLMMWTHRTNILRLHKGIENRLGHRTARPPDLEKKP